MNSKKYIVSHDFGYGKIPEQTFINKLKLRNLNDIKYYIQDILYNAFDCKTNNTAIEINNDIKQIIIERV